MAIEKYTTEAFILKQYEQGENDLVYKVWTKDFGVVFVLARSIRKVNAKLRPITKKNDFLVMTLVKGKDVWRLTGVEESKDRLLNNQYSFEIKKIISEVVDKFVEEKKTYKKLFEKLKSFILEDALSIFEVSKLKLLIYYLVLVDTGYADAKKIGAKDIEEYKSFSVQDFYTYLVLNEREVKEHLAFVLKNSML
ncbi:DNA repair protein RecO [bioreactor metagenome]|uniref:DNA repair protein RecO n=1 Tax=bioreactor metagenome TaxID=1076179 RepID=A0A644UA27_9ZZZZ|nr:recombination protein O N-terminal domain-containing protein [Candidatus Elulimicrobiales bacterium]